MSSHVLSFYLYWGQQHRSLGIRDDLAKLGAIQTYNFKTILINRIAIKKGRHKC